MNWKSFHSYLQIFGHLDEFPTGFVDVAERAGKVGEELRVPPLGQRGGPLFCRLHVQKDMINNDQLS
jgi:hypothetical protein